MTPVAWPRLTGLTAVQGVVGIIPFRWEATCTFSQRRCPTSHEAQTYGACGSSSLIVYLVIILSFHSDVPREFAGCSANLSTRSHPPTRSLDSERSSTQAFADERLPNLLYPQYAPCLRASGTPSS